MTMQTTAPLAHQNLQASNREVRGIARLAQSGQMLLDAPYQRGSVWTTEQQRNLIRSFLLGLPVPAIILNARWTWDDFDAGRPEWAVIDGRQRIEAAVAWYSGNLSVPASWFAPERIDQTIDTDDGPYVTYDRLTVIGQRLTSNRFTIPVAEGKLPSLAAEAEVFGLVNGAGTAQDDETMDRAAKIAAGG